MPGVSFPFDGLVLYALLPELKRAEGLFLRSVAQPSEFEARLLLGGHGQKLTIAISWEPGTPGAFVSSVQLKSKVPEESAFVRAMKERCGGMRLLAVRQHRLDRLLAFDFVGERHTYRLQVEMFGTHSNAFLIDERGVTVARARRARRPPTQPMEDFERDRIRVLEEMNSQESLSKVAKREVALRGAEDVLERISAPTPVVILGAGAYPFLPSDLAEADAISVGSMSAAVEQFCLSRARQQEQEARRHRIEQELKRRTSNARQALDRMQRAMDEAAVADQLQSEGDLLLARAHQIADGVSRAEIEDFEGRGVVLDLDPQKSPIENAEARYARARKARRAAAILGPRFDEMKEHLQELECMSAEFETAGADVSAIESRLSQRDASSAALSLRTLRTPSPRPHPRVSCTHLAGFEVWWGESAEANDFVTTKIAKGNDIWLHVRGHTGSHVVIATANRPERVQPHTILEAAKIAARHSTQKHARHVPVDYTLAKYVRKPRKSAPGQVTYSREKTLFVDP
ncbi:DUF814 domain-containing protein [Fimbriimonadia bacterium ATM]|nr:MAG: DUF814 domain-containing protein [Armatimonadota bacterium]MBC6968996.1 DUF814 domain-containing protein [Armatimonadota bacterium]MCE7900125.1 DUF814 domain-containing protein [Armatimonadetes bacterium ATM1]MDL1929426.1 DUF814 domain-containing protein [Fimbriimonadia bacterium ATM]RIJ95158.1 MAG: hypothetical protein DCC45_11185 [Armatimonadota bacterium]